MNKAQEAQANKETLQPVSILKTIIQIACAVLSGILLGISFPGFGYQELAFVGIIPMLYAVQSAAPKRAALLGWLCGFIFFMVSLSWLYQTTNTVEGFIFIAGCVLAYALLALICGLFFIPTAIITSRCIQRWGTQNFRKNILTMLCITATWVGLEYLRSFIFTGFPWNLIGVSQYENLPLIQVATWGGVYAISACMIWFSTSAFVTLMQYTHGTRKRKYRAHLELIIGILPIALCISYGFKTLMGVVPPTESINLALIQPNIPQYAKWDESLSDTIYKRLDELTDTATRSSKDLDLIIWPETALPDYLRLSESSAALIQKLAQQGVPILAGSVDADFTSEPTQYFNSSFLVNTKGQLVKKYDKQHLVPFGEYMPVPMIRKYTPIESDITAGKESTIFNVPGIAPFSALICFEDIVAPLAVNAVKSGARWLVNQTNDGWFDPSAQSEQHVAQAVFRCVENRVPMARCCNTGVSCVIDAYGGISRGIDVRTEGFSIDQISPRAEGAPLTFYTRYGDIFAKANLILAGIFSIGLFISGRKQSD